ILASGSSHGTIRLWAVNSGQALQILRGHTNWAAALCFSPDGRTLVSVSGDQSIRLWDMSTPDKLVSSQPLQTFQGYRRGIRAVSFSPDGQTLASGGTDGVIRLWDAKGDGTEPRHALTGHQILVTALGFSPDGHTLASADLRRFVYLWDLARPETIVGQLFECITTVYALCFNPNGHSLAIGITDHTIDIWDLATKQVSYTLTGHNETITALAFSPDGKILASSDADPTILLWNISAASTLSKVEGLTTSVASGQIIRHFQEPGRVWSVAFSPDGQTLASGGDAGVIYLWDIASESDQPRQRLAGHSAGISSIAFRPASQGHPQLLVSGSIDRSLRLWDIASGKTIHTLTGHTERVWSVCFSPDGQMVASGSDDGAVKFWDVTTGRCLSTRRPDRPYERTRIAGVTGLTSAQISALKELGAVDEGE
ncbi:MAG TPA: WD40 repeat domain-containing protein, partial [Caldilineaceae bacterium]|nr:WD40 repeat domain-containing protein [Caldilineaceae bacterium]